MYRLLLLFSGMFFANGIPHFINGISGNISDRPFFYRYLTFIPNSLFNVLWGLLSFAISIILLKFYEKGRSPMKIGFNPEFVLFSAGVLAASVFLSLYFIKNGW